MDVYIIIIYCALETKREIDKFCQQIFPILFLNDR